VVHRDGGAPGAALAVGIAGAVVHVLLLWPMGLQLVRGRWSAFVRQTLLPGLLPFAAALLACFLFRSAANLDSWWMVASGSLLAGTAYLGALLSVCLDSTDRGLAVGLWRRVQRLVAGRSSSLST
jgi:hypothetical protein